MASLDGVTNEKSSVFEDAAHDPDLEARLYAEIYYSNECYQQDSQFVAEGSRNLDTSLRSLAENDRARSSVENVARDANADRAVAPFEKFTNFGSIYSPRSWALGETREDDSCDFRKRSVVAKPWKRQRLLAHEGLWSSRVEPQAARDESRLVEADKDFAQKGRSVEAEIANRRAVANCSAIGSARSASDSIEAGNCVSRFNEAANLSTQFENDSVQAGNFTSDASRLNEAANLYTRFEGNSIEAGNFAPGTSRFNEAANLSTQFGSNLIEPGNITPGINRFERAANVSARFGGNYIEVGNIAPRENWFENVRNASATFRDDLIETGNTARRANSFKEARNSAAPFGSRSLRSKKPRHKVKNRSNVAGNVFGRPESNITGAGSFATLSVATNEAGNIFGQSASNLIGFENITPLSASAIEAGNIFSRSEDDYAGVESFASLSEAANEVRNIFGRFGSGLVNISENAPLTDYTVTHDYSHLLGDPLSEIGGKKRNTRRQRKVKRLRLLEEEKQRELQRLAKAACDEAVRKDNSKYKVVSKKNKLDMKQTALEPVNISSDSDDSILEVPVPPKTPPPLIQLQDSDDELQELRSNRSPSRRGERTAVERHDGFVAFQDLEIQSCEEDETSVAPIREAGPTNSPRALREAAKKSRDSEISVATANIQSPENCDDDGGKSRKKRTRRNKKSAESAEKSVESTEMSAESPASPIRNSSPTNLQRILRESAKKTKKSAESSKNYESPVSPIRNSSPTNLQRVQRESAKKTKKSAESAKKSADSFGNDESPASPIRNSSPTNLQRILRESTKMTKKSAEPAEKSAELSKNYESPASPIRNSSPTNLERIPRESAKKTKKSAESSKNDESPASPINNDVPTNLQRILRESADDPKNDESPASPTNSEPTNLQRISRESAKRSKSTTVPVEVSVVDDNLMLNCTEIQRGVSSLEEIKRMRDTFESNNAHSDDSMTESEATNWVNIAARQANTSRVDEEISSIDLSGDRTNLWDEMTQENRPAIANSFAEIAATVADINSPIQTFVGSTEGCLNNSVANSEVGITRKRQKDVAASTFDDFDVPVVPQKKAKQNRQKTSREQTMTEYFFKPMSKELQAFYNNPWDGNSQDVYDIQSRMPRNPNCWAILDADLRGPTSRKRKSCPRCKTDTHFGKKCPEKAKPPCCYMCGAKGHNESRCPHTMCLTCGRKHATYRPTCDHCSMLYCVTCNAAGHTYEKCPDLWRRYHNTTTETSPIAPRDPPRIMKPSQTLSCCNCGRRGHDITTCRQLRWSQHFPTPMYVTSYTEGPTYNPEAQNSINEIREIPQRFQYRDTDVDSPPIRDASRVVNPIVEDLNESIEIIEIPDDSSSSKPSTPAKTSSPEIRVVFQAGEPDAKKALKWPRAKKRLDTIKGIELTGLLSGNVKPTFLFRWQRHFSFVVKVTEEKSGRVLATCRANPVSLLKKFELVVWQWLTRSDAEKAYLVYDKLSYANRTTFGNELRIKLMLLNTVLKPVDLLKKIATSDKNLRETNANISDKQTKKNRRRLTALKSATSLCMSRRSQLVTSLYRGFWVQCGNESVENFRQLAALCTRDSNMNPRDYFHLVYIYNELFAFHATEELGDALKRAVAHSLESETAPPSDILVYPSAELPGNVELLRENDLTKYSNEKTNESGIGEITTNVESRGNAIADTLEESLRILANNGADCGANVSAPLTLERRMLDVCYSRESPEAAAITEDNRATRGNCKRIERDVLLANLPKKRRKKELRAAREMLKVARMTNVPRLVEMAKILKIKMNSCQARISDMDWLRSAISANLRARKAGDSGGSDGGGALKRFRGTKNLKREDNKAFDYNCLKLLRTL